jgi:hypothetical protein
MRRSFWLLCVYDEGMLPDLPNLRRQMEAAAKRAGVELRFHHEP